jgi:hypothetical protein
LFLSKKIAVFSAQKPVKILFYNFFGVEGCVVDHPRITIIKEEEEEIPKSIQLKPLVHVTLNI